LEYRGYDSAGVATLNGKGIELRKAVGKIAALEAAVVEARVARGCDVDQPRNLAKSVTVE
jgi:glucosamine--fructose-6-phosphate aminotransferase (isomerizing)